MARRAIQSLPKGTFEAEDEIDDDGFGNGPFPVRVKVTITRRRVPGRLHGQPRAGQRARSTPRPPGCARGVRAIYRAITAPDIPTNGGMFRPLRIVCPPRTVFTAERPMPTSFYFESGGFCLDLVWKALAPHMPDRLPAGHFLSICATT